MIVQILIGQAQLGNEVVFTVRVTILVYSVLVVIQCFNRKLLHIFRSC